MPGLDDFVSEMMALRPQRLRQLLRDPGPPHWAVERYMEQWPELVRERITVVDGEAVSTLEWTSDGIDVLIVLESRLRHMA